MRELTVNELDFVSGGTDAVEAARNMCRNLPDNTKVTITVNVGGSVGMGSTNTTNSTTVSVETTCGALRDSQD